MMNTPDETTPAPEAEAPASEGMRKLDIAAGGDEVPLGPLGGPKQKTREQLLAEQEIAAENSGEREAIDAAKAEIEAETPAPEPEPDAPLS